MKNLVKTTFILLSIIVSLISTLHAVQFFLLANGFWMSIFLAFAFELGQIATLLAIMNADRMNMRIVWTLFIFLTAFQIMSNVYYSFKYLDEDNYKVWSEVFFISDFKELPQKRIISFILGGFLPLLSAGFLKSLADYIKGFVEGKKKEDEDEEVETPIIPIGTKTPEELEKTLQSLTEAFSRKAEFKSEEDINKEISKAYVSGRKESNSKTIIEKSSIFSEINLGVLRLKEKDFSLRFEKILEIEPKLKSFKILKGLVDNKNIDKIEKYLNYNRKVYTLLANSLNTLEKNLKNANIY